MKRIHLTVLALAVLVVGVLLTAVPAEAQDWSGRGRLQGRVTTESGEPIQGAKVTLTELRSDDGPEPLITKKNGRWSILGLRNGQWQVQIEKDGYVTSSGVVQVSELKTNDPVMVSLRNVNDTEEAKRGREVIGDLEQANIYLREGKYAEARALYEKVLPEVQQESHPAILSGIAQTYLQEEKYAEALTTLQRVQEARPEDPTTLKLIATVQGRMGEVDAALASLKQLIELTPDDVDALQLTINLLLQNDREDEAQAYIDRLPEGASFDPNALLNLGIEQYNAGNMEEALGYFDRAVAANPSFPDVYYYRGLAHLASGNADDAKADLEKLIEIAPDHAKADEAKEFLAAL